MAHNGAFEELLGAGAGWARMLGAVAGDVAEALNPVAGNGHGSDDWLDAWDPEYIRTTLPTLRLFSDVYHRADVRGLNNIPEEGPVLLVGNHSGGTLISDTFVFAQAFYDHFGPLRRFHQLAHDLVFQLPGVRASLSRFGTVPASPENMGRALDRDAALLVYPGGDHETYRPSWESAKITIRALPKIDLKQRLGAKPDIEEAYEFVTGKMQKALHDLDAECSLPVIG